jgi:hypothetical protein
VLVTIEQTLSEVATASTAAVVTAAWVAAEAVTDTVVVTVWTEMTEPVTEAVASTVTVPVTLAAVDEALAVEATAAQESFWVVHSSTENPLPENLTQAVNCCPQAAAAAELRSEKSSSKTWNWLFFLATDGQSPPRARANSKKVSMTTTFLTNTFVTFLPFPPLEAAVATAETDAIETLDEATLALVVAADVVFANENEELTTALPLPPFLLVVVAFAAEDEEALAPLPALVVAETSLTDDEAVAPFTALVVLAALLDEESTAELVLAFLPLPALVVVALVAAAALLDEDETSAATALAVLVTTKPGPAATALAA